MKVLHGCFSCFLNCTNSTKSRKTSQVFMQFLIVAFYFHGLLLKKLPVPVWLIKDALIQDAQKALVQYA